MVIPLPFDKNLMETPWEYICAGYGRSVRYHPALLWDLISISDTKVRETIKGSRSYVRRWALAA